MRPHSVLYLWRCKIYLFLNEASSEFQLFYATCTFKKHRESLKAMDWLSQRRNCPDHEHLMQTEEIQ